MSGDFGVTDVPSNQPTATVIPFPQRQAATPTTRRIPLIAAPPRSEQERLSRALESLNAALAEQRAALKAWRGAMSELKASTTALEDGLQRYRGNLRSLSNSVTTLHQKARSLESWADSAADGTQGLGA
jgi:ABC-type transporter Mla subunit MlaD